MASTYRPWQYANRQVVRQRKVRDFRNNAAVYEENAPPAAPSPVQQAASALDETAAPKKGGGGLWGKVKDVGGDILEGAKDVGEIALSGEKLQDALGINTEYMDWLRSKGLVGKAAAYALDTATSPLTIATVGAGGWVGAGLRGATAGTRMATAGRVAGALAEPALSGNIARRAVAEVGAGVGAGLASEYAGDALEGAPRPVRTLGALAAGVAGGAAGLNAGRIARNAPEIAARAGLVPKGGVPFGAMVLSDGPMSDEYFDVLIRHGVEPRIDEHGFIWAEDLYDLAEKVKGTVDEPLVNDILSASVENTRVPGSTAWGGREVQRLEPERQPRSKAEKAGRDEAWAFVERYKGNTLDDARRAIEDELEAVQNKWFSPEMAAKTGVANNQSISTVDKYGNRRYRDRRASDPRASRVVKVRASMENWSEESVKKAVGAEEWWRVDELLRIQRQLDEMASATFAQPETVKRADLFGNVEDTGKTETELNGWTGEEPTAPVAKPRGPAIQQSFDGSVQELPGMGAIQAANEPARPMRTPAQIQREEGVPYVEAVRRSQGGGAEPQPMRTPAQIQREEGVPYVEAVRRSQGGGAEPKLTGTPAAAIPETGPGMEQRPRGELKESPVPDWERRTVPDMRQAEPEGYVTSIPEGQAARYRRVLKEDDLKWLRDHPERPPMSREEAKAALSGAGLAEIGDAYERLAALYHPHFNRPSATLPNDWAIIKKTARGKFQQAFIRDALDGMGVDRMDELDADLRRRVRADAWKSTKAAMAEIEEAVLRDEWWGGLEGLKGVGHMEGRPTGGIGGRVDEPAGTPPEPPGKEPPPPSGTGPDRAFGQDEPVDLLGTRPREKVVAEGRAKESRVPAQLMNRVRSALGRLESEDARVTVGSIMGERNRIQNVREHQVAWALLKERAALRGAGMETVRAKDGFVHLMADGRDVGLFEDVVERVSEAGRAGFASLSPEQQAALGTIGETNRLFNDTIRFHGGKPRIDPDIEGDYFGRRVTGRTYEGETGETIRVEKGQGNAPSRKVGAGRTKSRVLESMEELQAKGFDTEDPWVAREAILRGKLLDAEDGYLKKNLKSLRVKKPGSTLGLASVSGHPAFNNMWFEPDVARRIQKGLDTPAKGPLAAVGAVNSVLTPLRASFDLSATWQQGMRLWLSDPKHASEYWWEVAKSITKDDGVYDNLMLKLDQEGPGLQYLLERGLRFTGENTEGEFFFPKGLVEKAGKLGAPGKAINKTFTKSNQQFGRLLNSYRVQMANSQYQRLVASGLEGAELDDAMRQSVDGVNRAFGWTHAKPSTIEQAVLFAPKYTRATIETLKAAITQGGIEGSMARKHMALLLGEGATLVWLLNEARGYETEFDPRDPNFLRIRNVAGLDVSPFGSYATLFKAIAQTAAGDPTGQGLPDPTAIGKFVEGKLSPAVGAGYWPLKGKTYLGEPLEPFAGPEGFAKAALEQGKTNLPFGVQNLFGEGPAAAVVGSTGLSASPLSPAEKRDLARSGSPGGINLPGLGNIETTGREKPGLAEKMFGQDYDALPGSQKAQVNAQPAVRKQQEEVDRRAMRQGGDRGMAAQVRQQVEAELEASAQYLAQGTSADGKRYTGNDFRKAYHDTMLRAAGARKLIKDYGTDPELDGWFALYEQATMPNGQTDYDRLERAQAEYRAAHPDIDEKVDKITGIRDNAAVRELREAKKLAKAYYEIPGYRGMTVDEAEKAGEFLSLANDLVAHGKARNRRHALVLLREYDEEGAKLAMKAARVGANPERKKFRVANPTFGKFYSDVGLVTE